MLDLMRAHHGFNTNYSTQFGMLYGHGGGIGGGSEGAYGDGRGAQSAAMMLPNTIQIFIHVNSHNNRFVINGEGGKDPKEIIEHLFGQCLK